MRKKNQQFVKKFFSMLMIVMLSVVTIPLQTLASTADYETITISVGESKELKKPSTFSKATWESSDDDVVTVSNKGIITGKSIGQATITCTTTPLFKWIPSESKVTVYNIIVSAEEQTESEDVTTIYVGETIHLAVLDTNGKTSWKSSNTKVASVTNDGMVTGVGEGTATIIATTKSGGFNFGRFSWGGTSTTREVKIEVIAKEIEEPDKPTPEVKTYTVTFETNGGSTIESQIVEEGQCVAKPEDPVKEGYIFCGWYSNEELSFEYHFETEITSDIILYAKWEKETEYCTVVFESNGGTPIESQIIEKGNTVEKPEDPMKDNYFFDKWCIDSDLSVAYDFTTEVNEDITLYAKWISKDDNLVDEDIDLGDIESMVSDGKIEVIYGEQGEIKTIDGSFTDEKVNTVEDATEVLNHSATLFGATFNAEENDVIKQTADEGSDDEENYFRYAPTIDGILVLGSQIVISTDENGSVTGLFSTYDEAITSVDTSVGIDEDEAVTVALDAVMERTEVLDFLEGLPEYEGNEETIKATFLDELSVDKTLMIYAADKDTKPVLVYAVTVARYDFLENENDEDIEEDVDEEIGATPVLDLTYYIYANGDDCGTIYKTVANSEGWTTVQLEGTDLLGNTRVITGQEQEGTYRLKDTTRNLITYKTAKKGALWWTEYILPGNIAKSNSFLGNEWINKAGVSAHANMSKTYDYYENILGRNSFDGNGATVKVSYDYGSNYNNAYWSSDKQQFVFGSGKDYVAALDIVAHEYTHAVINYVVGNGHTTTLTYWGETGALNEAYADIMGNLIENKTGIDLWNHGEDKGSVTRSMSNPTDYDQPDHYNSLSDPDWSRQLDNYVDRDNEGVHIFGGVYCHAVYKMMTDSRCSTISNETWAKVFYHSLFRLGTDADFLDGRGAVLCAAKNLGFTSSQQQAIKDAFDAVGIKEPDGIRIVLTWGETPRDLDSHLVGPGVDGIRFHVYYAQRNYYQDGTYDSSDSLNAVDLDYDDTTSYGPEITTIHTLTPGTYYFYVHDFSNGSSSSSTEMANSGATVKIYRGSSNTLVGSYTVDSSSSGTYWNVCELNISDSGTVMIKIINTYDSSATLQ